MDRKSLAAVIVMAVSGVALWGCGDSDSVDGDGQNELPDIQYRVPVRRILKRVRTVPGLLQSPAILSRMIPGRPELLRTPLRPKNERPKNRQKP